MPNTEKYSGPDLEDLVNHSILLLFEEKKRSLQSTENGRNHLRMWCAGELEPTKFLEYLTQLP